MRMVLEMLEKQQTPFSAAQEGTATTRAKTDCGVRRGTGLQDAGIKEQARPAPALQSPFGALGGPGSRLSKQCGFQRARPN